MLVLQVVFFSQVSPSKSCMHLSSPIRATGLAHLILIDLITQLLFGEQCSRSDTVQLSWRICLNRVLESYQQHHRTKVKISFVIYDIV
jgi:hypothetical protein